MFTSFHTPLGWLPTCRPAGRTSPSRIPATPTVLTAVKCLAGAMPECVRPTEDSICGPGSETLRVAAAGNWSGRRLAGDMLVLLLADRPTAEANRRAVSSKGASGSFLPGVAMPETEVRPAGVAVPLLELPWPTVVGARRSVLSPPPLEELRGTGEGLAMTVSAGRRWKKERHGEQKETGREGE